MKFKIGREILVRWGVLLLIIASGSFYFQVLRMPLTFAMMMVTIGLFVATNRKIIKRNIKIFIAFFGVMILNTIINAGNGFNLNDFIITCGKLLYCVVLLSNLTLSEFKRLYVKTMVIIAIISLACFLWVDVFAFGRLPLQTINFSDSGIVNLTPYYTIGWSQGAFGRNAGPFGEPGSYQIFLNIALMYLLVNPVKPLATDKKNKLYIVILIITILTTMSTTGYLCLACIVAASVFQSKNSEGKNAKIFAIIALIALWIIEKYYGLISYKLSGGGSFNTRSNDTFSGLLLALQSPIVGIGIFSTNRNELMATVGIGSMSNGLVSLMICIGIPLTVFYLGMIFYSLRTNVKSSLLPTILLFTFYFLALNAEGGALNIIYLINLFAWKQEKKD